MTSLFEQLQREWETGQRPEIFSKDMPTDENGLAALGGDLSIELVLEAISKGYFPWTGEHPIPWYSPDPRLILKPSEFYASKSLRKLQRKGTYSIHFDRDYSATMNACRGMERLGQSGTWITDNMMKSYTTLHQHWITHSVEVYREQELVGGLYGFTLGKAFFGESMFSHEPNTSKLALYALCQQLTLWDFAFIDCQQETSHLQSLGAYAISREEYLEELAEALQSPSHHSSWVEFSPTLSER